MRAAPRWPVSFRRKSLPGPRFSVTNWSRLTQQTYEKLGQFYLGRVYDLPSRTLREELVLYDSRDLTTHGVIIGMTGSGKTGLGIGLIEEALIDGVPVIAIDPKGDIPNLLLTFPDLSAERLLPWINAQEGAQRGLSEEAFAARQAELWKTGLERWHQSPDRIRRLREGSEMVVYTPGSRAGLPVSVLRKLTPSPEAILEDGDLLREQIQSTTTNLLGLAGLQGDPTTDRAHILVANILKHAWQQGKALTLPDLIRAIQNPPFGEVGVFDLEAFFPAAERFQLALRLNNLLVTPGFEVWIEGEALNIPRFLFTTDGKPKASIFTISHLPEHERMFFVTSLLNALVDWVRTQPGTSSLRALLYLDEVFGYLPPVQSPPSKRPLLTLFKQARASGLGVVLSTQNRVDLDCKALTNTGIWFIGRLQTERDKARVLDGLEGAAAGGEFSRKHIEAVLAGLDKRVFYLHNVHEPEPTVFQTRWVLSYLSGPMTRDQIRRLMAPVKKRLAASTETSPPKITTAASAQLTQRSQPPATAPGVAVHFVPAQSGAQQTVYYPSLLGYVHIHYSSTRYGVEFSEQLLLAFPIESGPMPVRWENPVQLDLTPEQLTTRPARGIPFAELPAAATRKASYSRWQRTFKRAIVQSHPLVLLRAPKLKVHGLPGEDEETFRARLAQGCHGPRDAEVDKLRTRYASRFATLRERLLRAEQAVERERELASTATVQTVMSFGTALLGAFLGRRRVSTTAASRLGTAVSRASRAKKQKMDGRRARERAENLRRRLEALHDELEQKIAALTEKYDPARIEVRTVLLRPKSTDVRLQLFGLGWLPFERKPEDTLQPAFDRVQ